MERNDSKPYTVSASFYFLTLDKYIIISSLSIGIVLSVITVCIFIKCYQNRKKKNKSLRGYLHREDHLKHTERLLPGKNLAPPPTHSQQEPTNTVNNLKTAGDASILLDIQQRQQTSSDEKQIKPDQISLVEKISHGHLSSVWKGKLKEDLLSESLIAVKIFPSHEKLSWLNEKEIYSYLVDSEFILR
jgi:hypothetical protein